MIKFNGQQLKTLSAITADAGQVLFAITVVPFAFGLDKSHPTLLPLGLLSTIICWIASLVIMKGYKND